MVEQAADDAGVDVAASLPETDWFVRQLVGWARIRIEVGVTVTVGGQIMSGILCSQKQFIEHVRRQFAAHMNGLPEVSQAVDDTFSTILDAINEASNSDEPHPEPTYLHLKNAYVFSGHESLPTGPGMFWRCRIAAIDGISLGNLSVG